MKSAVAIAIDGVLRREVGYQPIPEGIALYRTLVLNWNVVLLSADFTQNDELEHFLRVEQLDQHSKVFYRWDQLRVVLAQKLRHSGMAVDFIVEADPEISAELMIAGFNVLHFMHAAYTRPTWRPGFEHTVTPWGSLVEQEVALKTAKATDKRVDL